MMLCFRINPGDVWAFIAVAIAACVREVFRHALPIVFLGDDVLDLERENAVGFRQVTVLASSSGSLPDSFPCFPVQAFTRIEASAALWISSGREACQRGGSFQEAMPHRE